MLYQILQALEGSVAGKSYDPTVWGHFFYNGQEYQIFDRWNFGEPIPADHSERFLLHEVHSEDENEWIFKGAYSSPEEVLKFFLA